MQKCMSFAASWEFKHTTPSPEFPNSNVQAKRAIQMVKNLLKKAWDSNRDPYIALLEYRNTPLDGTGYSRAQLLVCRRLKTKIPVSKSLLMPWLCKNMEQIDAQTKQAENLL